MIFGFCFWFSRICKCWGTSFWVYDREMYSIECYQMLFRKRECHKHSQIHENPRLNPKLKRSKIIRDDWSVVYLWYPCFILDPWTSPKADGHIILTDISIPCCYSCVPSLRQGHKSKNETRISPMNTDWSFTDTFFLIILSQWFLDFGLDSVGFASAGALPFGCMIGWCAR